MRIEKRLEVEDDPMVLRVHGSLLKHYEFELKLGELEEICQDLEDLRETVREREER